MNETEEPKRPDPCLDCAYSNFLRCKTDCHESCLEKGWFLDLVGLPDVPEYDVVLWAAVKWDGKKA